MILLFDGTLVNISLFKSYASGIGSKVNDTLRHNTSLDICERIGQTNGYGIWESKPKQNAIDNAKFNALKLDCNKISVVKPHDVIDSCQMHCEKQELCSFNSIEFLCVFSLFCVYFWRFRCKRWHILSQKKITLLSKRFSFFMRFRHRLLLYCEAEKQFAFESNYINFYLSLSTAFGWFTAIFFMVSRSQHLFGSAKSDDLFSMRYVFFSLLNRITFSWMANYISLILNVLLGEYDGRWMIAERQFHKMVQIVTEKNLCSEETRMYYSSVISAAHKCADDMSNPTFCEQRSKHNWSSAVLLERKGSNTNAISRLGI